MSKACALADAMRHLSSVCMGIVYGAIGENNNSELKTMLFIASIEQQKPKWEMSVNMK